MSPTWFFLKKKLCFFTLVSSVVFTSSPLVSSVFLLQTCGMYRFWVGASILKLLLLFSEFSKIETFNFLKFGPISPGKHTDIFDLKKPQKTGDCLNYFLNYHRQYPVRPWVQSSVGAFFFGDGGERFPAMTMSTAPVTRVTQWLEGLLKKIYWSIVFSLRGQIKKS